MTYSRYICLAAAGVIVIFSSGIVSAQDLKPGISLHPDSQRRLDPDEQAKRKAIDDAYKSTIKKIPDQKKSNDPWGSIRSTTTTSTRQR